jgi:glycosyltransferase involved in cell wall biosynthesis
MPSIGLVHDYLLVMRGAERSFAAITDIYPDAPIYTLLYDEAGTNGRFASRQVQVSPLQRLRVRQGGFRRLLPLFPLAASRLPVQDHDVVISSSSAFAHGIRPRADAVHVCYCYTPFRYAWYEQERALSEIAPPLRPVLNLALAGTRAWDRRAADRVTQYVAISRISQERIQRYFGRDAPIVHPPVETHRFAVGQPGKSFLVVCELVRHKQVEVALQAARRAGVSVDVVGTGPDLPRLRATYGDVATFLGRVPDEELAGVYARARALIVPNVEEFGIAAVEAQAAGRPVVAARAGGACETVVDGETGLLVRPGDVEDMAEALRATDFDRFDAQHLREHADEFSVEAFQRRLAAEVERAMG